MTRSIRAVPVLKLRQSRDARLGNPQWLSDQRLLGDLLTRAPGEGVVIPLRYERRATSLLIQQRVQILNPGASTTFSNPLYVVFRNSSGQLAPLRLAPTLSIAGATGGYEDDVTSWGLVPAPGEWLRWSLQWDPSLLIAWSIKATQLRKAQPGSVRWQDYPIIEAIFVAGTAAEHLIAELRLWEGMDRMVPGWPPQNPDLMDRRLDGREPGLIGYWKFNEGNGTRIGDSSRFGRDGTVTGGEWIAASASGLTLDCSLEDVQAARRNVITLKSRNQELGQALVALQQQGDRLDSSIQRWKAEEDKLAEALRPVEKQLSEENDRHAAWQRDIADRGKVALDKFSEDIAREIDEVIGRLDEKNSAYRLDRVGLEDKILPVQAGDERGSQDYRVIFPGADDPIDAQQLSTVRFAFEGRPKEEALNPVAVPDVRGYTELAARRKLRDTGFTARVMDQATDDGREIGRVVSQIVEEFGEKGRVVKQVLGSDVKVKPNSIVTVFLGRAGRESSGDGAAPEATGQR